MTDIQIQGPDEETVEALQHAALVLVHKEIAEWGEARLTKEDFARFETDSLNRAIRIELDGDDIVLKHVVINPRERCPGCGDYHEPPTLAN